MKQMYKVFLNDRLIEIGDSVNDKKNNLVVKFDEQTSADDIQSWLADFITQNSEKVTLGHPNPDHFLQLLRSAFLEVPAAGGMVISEDRLLFIFRNGKWDLPKGKIDKNETSAEAALREVSEECGISGQRIEKQLPSTFHIYQSPYAKTKGQWIFKETFWFEMIYNGTDEISPQQEEGITEVRWFRKNELDEVLANTYENLKQIIFLYCD
ncbi:NUDIX hydrolase [Mariniphaga sp.]|uniref:NUDIX hydrolase n=1 Tax=Mariniphaga sp. TaxID=1954475 RepID=UPI00356485F9